MTKNVFEGDKICANIKKVLFWIHFFSIWSSKKIDPQPRFPCFQVTRFSNVLQDVLESLLLSYTRKNNTAYTKKLIFPSDERIQILHESCKISIKAKK